MDGDCGCIALASATDSAVDDTAGTAMTAADSTKGFGNAKDLQMMATHE